MKRLLLLSLATVLFILFILLNYQSTPPVYCDLNKAVPEVIFGKAKPGGKLSFELPSSMEALRNQKNIFLTIQKILYLNLVSDRATNNFSLTKLAG